MDGIEIVDLQRYDEFVNTGRFKRSEQLLFLHVLYLLYCYIYRHVLKTKIRSIHAYDIGSSNSEICFGQPKKKNQNCHTAVNSLLFYPNLFRFVSKRVEVKIISC